MGMVTAMLANGNHSSPKRQEHGDQRSLVPSPPGPSVAALKENKSGVTIAKVCMNLSLSLSALSALSIYIYIVSLTPVLTEQKRCVCALQKEATSSGKGAGSSDQERVRDPKVSRLGFSQQLGRFTADIHA
jgi:hypothetical protein